MDPILQHIGEAVRAARTRHVWTQAELGEKLDLQPESVSNLERGATAPSLRLLIKAASVLELNMPEIFTAALATDESGKARYRLEAQLHATARSLDDKRLEMLIEIAEAVARGR